MMAEDMNLLSGRYREASVQATMKGSSDNQTAWVSSGSKRAASEHLEQNRPKIAKLAHENDDETYAEPEVKEESDARDAMIAQLRANLQKEKAKNAWLERELDEAEEERDEYNCRVLELEARESKRIEKESLVQTDKHAEMKLALKNLHSQRKADSQRKDKEMKTKYDTKLATQLEKNNDKWEKKWNEAQTRCQKLIADHKHEMKTVKDGHKEELRTTKENHKNEIKNLKPDHSKAMKEKIGDLKAAKEKIVDLKKTVASMDALMAEKESLADEVEKGKAKTKELVEKILRFQKANEDIQGQYKHKLEQEGQKWQIQHDQAESAKAELMSRQRSNFALRGELTNKTQKIHFLENQLQNVQTSTQISTADAIIQTSNKSDTYTNGERGEETAQGSNIYQPSAPILSAIDHTMNSMI